MYTTSKLLFILLFASGVSLVALAIVEPYSSQPKQSRDLNQPEIASTFKRFEENAPTLVKIFQLLSEVILVLVWMVDSCLNVFLWILNEAVTSCTEFSFRIFGALFHIVKLLEAFGFGVKFLLEVNYAIVSYLFDTAGCLKENFHHAVTLVKITLANETEHVYESSSMAWEGVQNLLLTTCNHIWGSIALAWGKVQCLVSLVVDNFTAYFGFPVPNVSLIASTSVAATKFFLESIVITAGVVTDGTIFLFKCVGDTIVGLVTRFLANALVIFNTVLQTITMVTGHVIFVVTWPVGVFGSIVSKVTYLLCNLWETVVNQAAYLDESIRGFIQFGFRTLAQVTSTSVSKTLTFTKMYVPGGIAGLCIIICAVSGLVLSRKSILSLLSSTWISLRRINADAREHVARDGLDIEDNEHTVDENTEEVEYHRPEPSSKTKMSKGQTKLKYELEREKDKRLCVICQDNVKNVLLLPCRHVCLCQRCLQEIRHGRVQLVQCPLCRERIQSTMDVFV